MALETPYRIEPCRLETVPEELLRVASEVAARATTLGSRLHPKTTASLADLVRVMNCYYSNLIEGHNTRPRDIERALANDWESGERRDLQLEARAHIRVQSVIDERYARETLPEPASIEFIRWLHREFYADAPISSLTIKQPPGQLSGSR